MKTTLIPKAKVTRDHQMLAIAFAKALDVDISSAEELELVAMMFATYEQALLTMEPKVVEQFLLSLE